MHTRLISPCLFLVFLAFLVLAQPFNSTALAQSQITIDPTSRRAIGGISTLDRTRFFNHHGTLAPPSSTNIGNLAETLVLENGLHSSTGRTSTEFDQFLANTLPEDPNRPGFIDPNQLRQKLRTDYRNFVVNGTRYRSLRDNPNALLINSGRSAQFWPEFMRTDPNTGTVSNYFPNKAAYAEFLNIYLDEVVYGPNAFMPVSSDRFYIELLNEPDLHLNSNFTAQDMAEYHRDIAIAIKAQHPGAKIGGASLAITSFARNGFERWNGVSKPFMETAGSDVDFYSMHPYERYRVRPDGSYLQDIYQSPGRIDAMIDLVQNQQEILHGDRKKIAFTEYGSWQLLQATDENGNPSTGDYPRDLQQWNLVTDIRDKMMVMLDRPDTIVNATPFVSPVDWRNQTPTSAEGDNVFWEKDANGDWQETIVAKLYRSLAPVQGEYINISNDNRNIQQAAFRDGNQVFVILNNLVGQTQDVSLDFQGGFGQINSVSIDRLYRLNDTNTFINDQDFFNSYENFSLFGDEGAVLTFTLEGVEDFQVQTNETTYYGNEVTAAISQENTVIDFQGLDLQNVVEAVFRINYSRDDLSPSAIDLFINGNLISIDDAAWAIDDGDLDWFSREILVPVAYLSDGFNQVEIAFEGSGGYISSSAFVLISSIPEPNAAIAMAVGMLGLLPRRRKAIDDKK